MIEDITRYTPYLKTAFLLADILTKASNFHDMTTTIFSFDCFSFFLFFLTPAMKVGKV